VEGVHHCDRVGQFLVVAVLKPVNPSIATTSTPSRQDVSSFAEPGLEHLLRSALDHIQQPRWTGAVADWRQVDDHHGDVLVAAAGVVPAVLVDTDHARALEPVWVLDQHTPALGDPSDGQVLTHDPF
jgi:hypothetical protein